MRIRLKERRAETKDVLSFVFDLGGELLQYQAGQYTYYALDRLAFPDEQGNQRHFTISCSPTDKGILMFTTRMRGSGFKETLRHAPIGYEMSCEEPRGRFILQEGDQERHHVFIAGGIGITPYRSILRYAFHAKEQLNATLLYFNRSSADIVFHSELEELTEQLPHFSLVHVLSEPEPCAAEKLGAINDALTKTPLLREDIPGVYCSTGTATCQDLDPSQSCMCGTCSVFKEYDLGDGTPVGYYCRDGHAR